jgi:hypothetical protein
LKSPNVRRIFVSELEHPMDFKKPSITEIVRAQREARGNGSSPVHSVPAVDRMMLDVALGKVAAIEKTLEAARSDARSAARRAGVSGSYLFEATSFIPRSTGHRWRDEGIEQGKAQRANEIIRALQAAQNPDPKFAGVRAWAAQMLRRRRAAGFADDDVLTDDQCTALLRGTLVADDPDAIEAEAEAKITAEAKVKAEAILAAAALRDAGGPSLPDPPKGSLAARVIDAGKARRRPFGDD